ncbi:stAR-related lipid transfer protein 5-like [Lingula anatina]|nr:stAR-related lipid transfer protein 5-like [Lingula anatina]|eukprot:XP_013394480.1 stAR-related lipid transfer protein 5-like [Lingula anatina]
MDKQELAEQIKKKIEEYTTDHENWKVVKKGKDVTVYCRSSTEFQGNIYKAEGTVDAKPEKVFEYVEPKPDGLRPKWDKAIKAVDTIEKIEEGLSVMRTCTHSAAMGLISPRDFLDLCLTVKNENSICTVAGSIEHPDCPVEPKYVRGTNHPCGICCFRIDG